jgi:hypothetical protein
MHREDVDVMPAVDGPVIWFRNGVSETTGNAVTR